jgi:hypothetical protein
MVLFFLQSCGKPADAKKPYNLMTEDQMVSVLYDIALLESIKSQKPISLDRKGINPKTYVFKKYKIDSLQFARSNHYYSADVPAYKRIFERVDKRLERKQKEVDSLLKKKIGIIVDPDQPMVR